MIFIQKPVDAWWRSRYCELSLTYKMGEPSTIATHYHAHSQTSLQIWWLQPCDTSSLFFHNRLLSSAVVNSLYTTFYHTFTDPFSGLCKPHVCPYFLHIYIHPLCILVITHYLSCILLNNELNKCWGELKMQGDKATAGPIGLLKGCTTTGVVPELHGESLVRVTSTTWTLSRCTYLSSSPTSSWTTSTYSSPSSPSCWTDSSLL